MALTNRDPILSTPDEKVSALLRQLPWTHNLIILGQFKHPEGPEFSLKMAIQERWSARDLERQFNAALCELYEFYALNAPRHSVPAQSISNGG
jgi:hypothetical protein